MKKTFLLSLMLLLGMSCLFFTSCNNGNSDPDDDNTSVTFTDVDWDADISWFVGTWETEKIISQGTDITDLETQVIEFSAEKKFVKWTSSLAGEIIPANTDLDSIKSLLKTNYKTQVNEDKTKLKRTTTAGSLATYYYFTKK